MSPASLGQSPGDQIEQQLQQQERLIQRQEERLEALRRQQENERRTRTDRHPDHNEQLPAESVSDACLVIEQIVIDDVESIEYASIEPLIAPYRGQCLSVKDINSILTKVNRLYTDHGFITSRAYIGPQDLNLGILTIKVVEGTVEHIERPLTDPNKQSLQKIFRNLDGKVLNLRDLEQGLEQINRLASRSATMALLPGSVSGQSIVEVSEIKTTKAWQIRHKIDNSGQLATGEIQHQLFGSAENLMGLYDYSYFSLQADDGSLSKDQFSRSAGLHWDIPFGYWTLSTDHSYFKYSSIIATPVQSFISAGDSRSNEIRVARLLSRDQVSKTKVSLSIKRKTSHSYIENVLIEASSRTHSIASLGLSNDRYLKSGGILSSSIKIHRGLRILGGMNDRGQEAAGPKAEFTKFSLGVNLSRPLGNPSKKLSYASRFQYDYSADELYGSEKISLGSDYSVRGYKGVGISGARGGYWRNDIKWTYTVDKSRPMSRWLSTISPFIGLDIGAAFVATQEGVEHQSIKGWAFGIGTSSSHWSLNLLYSEPWAPRPSLRAAKSQLSIDFSAIF